MAPTTPASTWWNRPEKDHSSGKLESTHPSRTSVKSYQVCTVFARCLETGNVCHSITTRETPKRQMKKTLFTRHRNTVEPMMLANNRKATLQAIHSDAVNRAVKDQKRI